MTSRSNPTFEHRHFKELASIIADMQSEFAWPQDHIAQHFAERLARTNPRFDRERFLAAARGEPSNGREGGYINA